MVNRSNLEKKAIDFVKLQTELLKQYRRKLSRSEMNRILGLSHNLYHRWESGKHRIGWSDFVKIAVFSGFDIKASLRKCMFNDADPEDAAAIILSLTEHQERAKLTSILGVSSQSIDRWTSGESHPTMIDVFKIMQSTSYRFFDFIESIADVKFLESIRREFDISKMERELHIKYPWISLVPRSLELEKYRILAEHEDGYVAETLGLTMEQEKFAIEQLLILGLVWWKDGKLEVDSRMIRTSGFVDKSALRDLISYWGHYHADVWKSEAERLRMGRFDTTSGAGGIYYSFSSSEGTYEEIKKRFIEFDKDINLIMSSPNEAGKLTRVGNIYMSFFDSVSAARVSRILKNEPNDK